MTTETTLVKSLAGLRQEFDATFAAARQAAGDGRESLITLRVGGETFAVRTKHIAGVAKRRRVVPVPTTVPGLLGIMALRGALLPVYDCAALLGIPGTGGRGAWVVLTGPEPPAGFVFDEFESQVEIERSCLCESDPDRAREHLRLVARIGKVNRAVIDIPGVVQQIRKNAAIFQAARE